jgi:hypothetical protein
MRSIRGMKVNNAIDNGNPHSHRILSGLTCDKWGGPSPEAAKEMEYSANIFLRNDYPTE